MLKIAAIQYIIPIPKKKIPNIQLWKERYFTEQKIQTFQFNLKYV